MLALSAMNLAGDVPCEQRVAARFASVFAIQEPAEDEHTQRPANDQANARQFSAKCVHKRHREKRANKERKSEYFASVFVVRELTCQFVDDDDWASEHNEHKHISPSDDRGRQQPSANIA
jgi:hypothetical protein